MVWIKNVVNRLIYLDTWSPAGGAVWGCYGNLGREDLLKEVCHPGRNLRVYNFALIPVYSLFPACDWERGLSVSCSSCLLPAIANSPSGSVSQNKAISTYKSLLVMVFYQSNKKELRQSPHYNLLVNFWLFCLSLKEGVCPLLELSLGIAVKVKGRLEKGLSR